MNSFGQNLLYAPFVWTVFYKKTNNNVGNQL